MDVGGAVRAIDLVEARLDVEAEPPVVAHLGGRVVSCRRVDASDDDLLHGRHGCPRVRIDDRARQQAGRIHVEAHALPLPDIHLSPEFLAVRPDHGVVLTRVEPLEGVCAVGAGGRIRIARAPQRDRRVGGGNAAEDNEPFDRRRLGPPDLEDASLARMEQESHLRDGLERGAQDKHIDGLRRVESMDLESAVGAGDRGRDQCVAPRHHKDKGPGERAGRCPHVTRDRGAVSERRAPVVSGPSAGETEETWRIAVPADADKRALEVPVAIAAAQLVHAIPAVLRRQ